MAPLVIFAGKVAIGASIDLVAQISTGMATHGHSFGDALKDVDWTSVAGSGIEAGLASPGMSRTKASEDYLKCNGENHQFSFEFRNKFK